MREAIDDLLAMRRPDPRGLSRTISWSLGVHVIAVVVLMLAPRLGWIARKPPQKIMVISLGGVEGAKPGPTTIGGRPVEEVAPPPKRPTPTPPAATKPNVMTVPEKAAPPPPKKAAPPPPPPKVQPKAPSTVTRPPTVGRQVSPGNSRAETGVTGVGSGLQIGSGAGFASTSTLTDFCCMAYLNNEVVARLRARWDPNQPARGNVVVQFTIERNGTVSDLSVVEHADFLLDQASLRPFLLLNRTLPPLPAEYKPSTITLRLTFEYK